ncbi:S-adenosyl-L-methionine-dependent methyltransferase [Obelidium mucronatum]|nr:S-adenosyl-L-methionine-dependent methyltransferase [Obelidium mucronatum]
MSEKWNDAAKRYSEWSTRQTLRYAQDALDLLNIPPNASARILDIATGDGAFALEAAARHPTSLIEAVDYSSGMIDILDGKIRELGLQGVVTTNVVDAHDLPYPDNSFDHVAVIFGLFLMKDSVQCLKEIHRVLKPGGKLVFTSWGSTFASDLLLASLMVVNPEAAITRVLKKCTTTEPKQMLWNDHDWLRAQCSAFENIQVTVASHPVRVGASEVDSFVGMFAGGPGIQYLMKAEGWDDERDTVRVSEALTIVFKKMIGDGGREFIELVSSANLVCCRKASQ